MDDCKHNLIILSVTFSLCPENSSPVSVRVGVGRSCTEHDLISPVLIVVIRGRLSMGTFKGIKLSLN